MAGKFLWTAILAISFGLLSVKPSSAEVAGYGKLPLSFEINSGQTDARVRFLARGRGYGLFLTDDEAVFSLTPGGGVLRMRLEGSTPDPRIEGLAQLPGNSHYLIGHDPGKWRPNTPNYAKVRYSGVYPGIDLLYYGNQQQLEFDFVVSPGADPNAIRLGFQGAQGLSVNSDGDLVLQMPGGEIQQKRPVIYQEIEGSKKLIEGSYLLLGEDQVGFSIAAYDSNVPLVIDPVLVYSTYVGGLSTSGLGDHGYAIAVDAEGNTYVTGFTTSAGFPAGASLDATLGGGTDAFVLKLNAAGDTTFFSTFIGGSADDEGRGIALDSAGNIVISGSTTSSDFPVVNAFRGTRAGNQDAFVLKMNNSGTVVSFSTFLGGTLDDRAFGVAIDTANSIYVAGVAASTNFPTVSALQSVHAGGLGDIFITKMNPAGTPVYSTYYGGRGHDQAYGIAVDAAGSAYVTGYTTSTNFPVVNAFQKDYAGGVDDALLVKLNPSGSAAVFSTYLGGGESDNGVRLALDSAGSAYVTGYTASPNFPVVTPLQTDNLGSFDIFVTKFASDGASLAYSTFIGGFGSESGAGIAVDRSGSAYITGFTTSFELPAVNAVQINLSGDQDAYVIKLNPEGTKFLYSTYLGGTGLEGGIGLALDSQNNVYLTGYSTATNFPVANPLQPENAGGRDAFIAKIDASDVRDNTPFGVLTQGFSTISTGANNDQPVFGYALAEVNQGTPVHAGEAIISLDGLGGIVTEVGISAPPLITEGRFFVEVEQTSRSVISIANHTDEDVTFEFYFTDKDGVSSSSGSHTVTARNLFSRFVSDPPFNIPLESVGTLSIHSPVPLAMTGFGTNATQESNLLLNVSPIAEIKIGDNKRTIIPQFADSLGWDTRVILFNPTEDRMNGEIHFFSGNGSEPGAPVEVTVNGGPGSVFEFDIPGRSYQEFQTSALAETLLTGWVEVVPFQGSRTPAAHAILTHVHDGVTASKTSVNALVPSTSFRLIAEASGDFQAAESLSKRTAIAIANPGSVPATVQLQLLTTAGQPSGASGTLTIPPKGHFAAFLHEISGFENVVLPYQGILQVTTSSLEGISIVGMRGRYNQLGRFLATTTGPLTENAGIGSTLIFPHIAEGDGYSTQFILVGEKTGASSGTLRLFDQEGQPLNVTLH